MADVKKRCRRGGCNKFFVDSENTDNACRFHVGKPMFHDTKKGWTCCAKVVYDWDEFATIETCAVGMHSDVDPMQAAQGQDGFFKSNTVANAQIAADKIEAKPVVIKKIADFEAETKKVEAAPKKELQIFLTPAGKRKCINKGCLKDYVEEENADQACSYHIGGPVFHDIKKFWTCCKVRRSSFSHILISPIHARSLYSQKETMDWDEFMKLPTCTVGRHAPKMV